MYISNFWFCLYYRVWRKYLLIVSVNVCTSVIRLLSDSLLDFRFVRQLGSTSLTRILLLYPAGYDGRSLVMTIMW